MHLPKSNSKFIGQGLTGTEGSTSLAHMLGYGTKIVAGVTPGKGGQEVQGVPIFNTVKEALKKVGKVDGTVQFVPPLFTKGAVVEAIDAGIKFILIGAEKVPTRDAAEMFALAKKKRVTIIGPSSVVIISPKNKIKLGQIGGGTPERVFVKGNIGVISKSGGMTSELGLILKNNGMGVSWAVGIGGDRIICTDFTDFLMELEQDKDTKASVVFGELGGKYEEKIAEYVRKGKIKKPVVAFIAGEFTNKLPSDVQFGHAGAIIEGKRGLPSEKRKILKEAGILVAENFDEIPVLLRKILSSS